MNIGNLYEVEFESPYYPFGPTQQMLPIKVAAMSVLDAINKVSTQFPSPVASVKMLVAGIQY